jgi:hypothetical protein
VTEQERDLTLEELAFLQRHPGVPEKLVPAFLDELKRQRAVREGANRAAKHGLIGQWLPIIGSGTARETAAP